MPDIAIEVGTNSYASVEEADAYMSTRLYADAWHEAAEPDQAKALMMATRAIERLTLVGRPVDTEQPLAFPRRGFDWKQDEIPAAVKQATIEEALALLDTDHELRRNLRNYGVTSVSIGNVREGLINRSNRHGGAIGPPELRSQEARELMRPHIAGSVPIR